MLITVPILLFIVLQFLHLHLIHLFFFCIFPHLHLFRVFKDRYIRFLSLFQPLRFVSPSSFITSLLPLCFFFASEAISCQQPYLHCTPLLLVISPMVEGKATLVLGSSSALPPHIHSYRDLSFIPIVISPFPLLPLTPLSVAQTNLPCLPLCLYVCYFVTQPCVTLSCICCILSLFLCFLVLSAQIFHCRRCLLRGESLCKVTRQTWVRVAACFMHLDSCMLCCCFLLSSTMFSSWFGSFFILRIVLHNIFWYDPESGHCVLLLLILRQLKTRRHKCLHCFWQSAFSHQIMYTLANRFGEILVRNSNSRSTLTTVVQHNRNAHQGSITGLTRISIFCRLLADFSKGVAAFTMGRAWVGIVIQTKTT